MSSPFSEFIFSALYFVTSPVAISFIDDFHMQYMMENAIAKLTPNLKTVVILYYYNDMTTNEIAKITGCLKATVRSRLFYARCALKKMIQAM